MTINKNVAVNDLKRFAGQCHTPLNIVDSRFGGILEDNDIPAFGLNKLVDTFQNKNLVALEDGPGVYGFNTIVANSV